MATELDTPEVLETVTRKAITHWSCQISYNLDGTPDTDNIYFEYIVSEFNSLGEGVNQEVARVDFSGWPVAFKTDVKSVHNKVINHAKSSGYIGTGTDSDDMP